MTLIWTRLLETIDSQGAAALVSVVGVRGSAPREAGARMIVRPDGGFWGTVGGGELEWRLLRDAKAALAADARATLVGDWPLGPDLGQCCGGRVKAWVETFTIADRAEVARFAAFESRGPFDLEASIGPDGRISRRVAVEAAPSVAVVRERHGDDRTPVLLFGAGHVGRALALALAPLPFHVRWVDPRKDAFPALIPQNAEALLTADPVRAVASAPAGSLVMVMTHSHPLDLAITAAALGRSDLSLVGLIGSATKRARFLARLRQGGVSEAALLRLVCPIGVEGVSGKEPAVIAAVAAAQLLQWREAQDAARIQTTSVAASFRPRRLSGERG